MGLASMLQTGTPPPGGAAPQGGAPQGASGPSAPPFPGAQGASWARSSPGRTSGAAVWPAVFGLEQQQGALQVSSSSSGAQGQGRTPPAIRSSSSRSSPATPRLAPAGAVQASSIPPPQAVPTRRCQAQAILGLLAMALVAGVSTPQAPRHLHCSLPSTHVCLAGQQGGQQGGYPGASRQLPSLSGSLLARPQQI